MNILFFSSRFYPDIGGVEKHVYYVALHLVRQGHKVTVVTEKHSSYKKNEDIDGIQIIRFDFGKKSWVKKFNIWNVLWQNRKLIVQSNIIHCHDVFVWYLPFRIVYPSKQIFTTFHGYETRFPLSKKAILIRKISEKLSHGNICVGSYIKKWYGTKTDFITYGGIGQKSKIKNQSHRSKFKIVFIGRIEQDNGIKTYVEVLEELRINKAPFEFQAVGDGSMRGEFEKFGKVIGFVSETNNLVSDADVVFASSYLSMLEALAQKKLVVSVYENPLKRDYLLDSPFEKYCIMGAAAQEIGEKILYYQKHPKERASFTENGYNFASLQTWEKVTDLYKQLWNI